MRYLFFDIECADGNVGICEFGYVLSDTNFRVIKKKNFVINPRAKFQLRGRPGRPDINLSYPYETYINAPEYDEFYDNIKFLMTQKDLLIFGHSVLNDILYLVKDNRRYHLNQFYYTAYDTQNIYSYFDSSRKKFISLDNAVEKLIGIEEKSKLISHRAMDDAYMTMLELQAMVQALGFEVNDILDVCKTCKHTVEEAIVSNNERRQRIKASYKYKPKSECQVMWGNFYREKLNLLEDEKYIGKFITISSLIKQNIDILESIINKIKEKDYAPYDKISGADIIIVKDEEDKQRMLLNFRHPYNGSFITVDEFLK